MSNESDMNHRVHQFEQAVQSDGGRAAYKIATMVIGILLTILLTLSTVMLAQIRDSTNDATATNNRQDNVNIRQDADIQFADRRAAEFQAAQTKQAEILQSLVVQVNHIADTVDANKSAIKRSQR